MNREIINEWFGGPVLHAHLQIENKIIHHDVESHQFTQDGIVSYLQRFYNNKRVLISDTNHALIQVFRNEERWNIEKFKSRQDLNLEKVLYSSNEVEIRRNEMLPNNSILTGVETDIVGERGELTTTNEELSKLDIVVASLHWRTWKTFRGSDETTEESKKMILQAYSHVSENTNVDILGHPVVFTSQLNSEFSAKDFIVILEKMKSNNIAMEINLSYISDSPSGKLYLELIKAAVKIGVPLTIGTDLHHLKYYNFPDYFSDYITGKNWQEAFEFHQKSGWHFYLLRYLSRNIQMLKELGVSPEQVVNSSFENFFKWWKGRNPGNLFTS
jgi:histidinol phosphatase-like PHP family hydrolase